MPSISGGATAQSSAPGQGGCRLWVWVWAWKGGCKAGGLEGMKDCFQGRDSGSLFCLGLSI